MAAGLWNPHCCLSAHASCPSPLVNPNIYRPPTTLLPDRHRPMFLALVHLATPLSSPAPLLSQRWTHLDSVRPPLLHGETSHQSTATRSQPPIHSHRFTRSSRHHAVALLDRWQPHPRARVHCSHAHAGALSCRPLRAQRAAPRSRPFTAVHSQPASLGEERGGRRGGLCRGTAPPWHGLTRRSPSNSTPVVAAHRSRSRAAVRRRHPRRAPDDAPGSGSPPPHATRPAPSHTPS